MTDCKHSQAVGCNHCQISSGATEQKRPSTQIRERAKELFNTMLMKGPITHDDMPFVLLETHLQAQDEYLDQLVGFPKDQ